MAGLERDDDRRKLIARLTAKGEIIVEEAFAVAMARLGTLFRSFSRKELATLTALLNRARDAASSTPLPVGLRSAQVLVGSVKRT